MQKVRINLNAHSTDISHAEARKCLGFAENLVSLQLSLREMLHLHSSILERGTSDVSLFLKALQSSSEPELSNVAPALLHLREVQQLMRQCGRTLDECIKFLDSCSRKNDSLLGTLQNTGERLSTLDQVSFCYGDIDVQSVVEARWMGRCWGVMIVLILTPFSSAGPWLGFGPMWRSWHNSDARFERTTSCAMQWSEGLLFGGAAFTCCCTGSVLRLGTRS